MVLKLYLFATLIAFFQIRNVAPRDLIVNFYEDSCTESCNKSIENPDGILKLPPGYEKFNTSYYKYHREPQSWYEARKTCESEGAYLTVINSKAEALFLQDLMKKYPENVLDDVFYKNYILIGFHDLFKEGDYVTVQGQSLDQTGYTTWATNQPDNFDGVDNCGSLHRFGGLNDFPCTQPIPFVCEFSPSNCSSLFTNKTQQLRIENLRFVKITENSSQLRILTKNCLNIFKEYVIPKSNCTLIIQNLAVNDLGISDSEEQTSTLSTAKLSSSTGGEDVAAPTTPSSSGKVPAMDESGADQAMDESGTDQTTTEMSPSKTIKGTTEKSSSGKVKAKDKKSSSKTCKAKTKKRPIKIVQTTTQKSSSRNVQATTEISSSGNVEAMDEMSSDNTGKATTEISSIKTVQATTEISSSGKIEAMDEMSSVNTSKAKTEMSSIKTVQATTEISSNGNVQVMDEMSSDNTGKATTEISSIKTVQVTTEIYSSGNVEAMDEMSSDNTSKAATEISSINTVQATTEISSSGNVPAMDEMSSGNTDQASTDIPSSGIVEETDEISSSNTVQGSTDISLIKTVQATTEVSSNENVQAVDELSSSKTDQDLTEMPNDALKVTPSTKTSVNTTEVVKATTAKGIIIRVETRKNV